MRWPGTTLLAAALLVGGCGTETGEAAPATRVVAEDTPTSTPQTIPTLVGSATTTASSTTVPAAPVGEPSSTPTSTPSSTTSTTDAGAPPTTPGTLPEEPVPPTTTEPPVPTSTSPETAHEWTAHPLAAGVLDASDLGTGWERTDVDVVEASTGGGGEDICGQASPASPAGLEATYDHGDLRSAQLVVGTGTESSTTIDAFRSAIDCDFGGELGPGAVISEIDATALAADDAVGARVVLDDEFAELSMTFVIARWGDTLVAVSAGSFGGEQQASGVDVLELASLVRDRLAAAGGLS